MPDKWVFHWPGSPPGGPGYDVAEPPFTLEKSLAALQSWENFHIDVRMWQGIAYNYAVDMAGRVFMLRGEQRAAATSGDQEPDGIPENHEARAVLLMINTKTTALTGEMVEAIRKLWALDPGPVFGHKEISTTGTACPGETVMQFIEEKGYEMTFEDDHGTDYESYKDSHRLPELPTWAETAWNRYLEAGGSTVPQSGQWHAYRHDVAIMWDKFVRPLMAQVAALNARVTELEKQPPGTGLKFGDVVKLTEP